MSGKRVERVELGCHWAIGYLWKFANQKFNKFFDSILCFCYASLFQLEFRLTVFFSCQFHLCRLFLYAYPTTPYYICCGLPRSSQNGLRLDLSDKLQTMPKTVAPSNLILLSPTAAPKIFVAISHSFTFNRCGFHLHNKMSEQKNSATERLNNLELPMLLLLLCRCCSVAAAVYANVAAGWAASVKTRCLICIKIFFVSSSNFNQRRRRRRRREIEKKKKHVRQHNGRTLSWSPA